MKKTVYRLILKLIGWKITGNKTLSKDTIKKAVIITVPHTHWLDFYLGILIRGSIGFKSNYLQVQDSVPEQTHDIQLQPAPIL